MINSELYLNPVSRPRPKRLINGHASLNQPVLTLAANSLNSPLDNRFNYFLKRGADLFLSSIFIVGVLSWLVPIVGLIIKLTSKGPVFFIQKRNKRNGEVFSCIKFRSMVDSHEDDLMPTTDHHYRVTPIGRILRKYHIDELPQLLNVWLGDMSVVGPRPHMVNENAQYRLLLAGYDQRHHVKPGITGLAQSHGYIGPCDTVYHMSKRLQLDREYITTWSVFKDVKIVGRTIRMTLKK